MRIFRETFRAILCGKPRMYARMTELNSVGNEWENKATLMA